MRHICERSRDTTDMVCHNKAGTGDTSMTIDFAFTVYK